MLFIPNRSDSKVGRLLNPPPYPALITQRRIIARKTIPLLIPFVTIIRPENAIDRMKINL